MGYYADLINEKKEKQNKVVKRGTFKSGNWWISQETAWPNKIVYSAHAEYTSGPYKGEHHGTDSFDSLAKAESYVKRLNSKEEKGYYAKLAEEKNANPYHIALSLIKDKHSVNDMVRELTSNYGVSKSEALHAIEKAAKDSHEAEIERKARELY